MQLVNIEGRATLAAEGFAYDLATLSGGTLGPTSSDALAAWDEVVELARVGTFDDGVPLTDLSLGPPIDRPGTIYAVGLNYASHVAGAGLAPRRAPSVFVKFAGSLSGPCSDIVVPAGEAMVDWEAEVGVVVGRAGRHIAAADALDHVAGYLAANDVSERHLQVESGPSLGKSFDTFCPTGPALVTLDELEDPLDVEIRCWVNDELMQDGHTRDMITDVPHILELLSSVTTLQPGDIVLTGTPAGTGYEREPKRFLAPGDVVVTEVTGLGRLVNRCVADPG
jgi:2,4-didehydro-3-deoxy-L-rhamnonate hydrolase